MKVLLKRVGNGHYHVFKITKEEHIYFESFWPSDMKPMLGLKRHIPIDTEKVFIWNPPLQEPKGKK